jgi:hypothetical protein
MARISKTEFIREETTYLICCEECGADRVVTVGGIHCPRHGQFRSFDSIALALIDEGLTLSEFCEAWKLAATEER